jgi:hypothetical protein
MEPTQEAGGKNTEPGLVTTLIAVAASIAAMFAVVVITGQIP